MDFLEDFTPDTQMDAHTAEQIAKFAIREHHALQKEKELATLLQILSILKPKIVVEIGLHRGGTMWSWMQASPQGSTFIGIDLPGGVGGDFDTSLITGLDTYARYRNQEFKCLLGESQKYATLSWLEEILDGRLIDFLFIDGDHQYVPVSKDWSMYGQLARLVAFHDIVEVKQEEMGPMGVSKLWRKLVLSDLTTFEIVEDLHLPDPISNSFPYAGIGCVIPDNKAVPELIIKDRCTECFTTANCLIKGSCRLYNRPDHDPI